MKDLKNLNGIVTVKCIGFKYFLEVCDNTGAMICEGADYEAEIRRAINTLSDKSIASAEYFVNTANEAYVYDINQEALELGKDWGLSFIIEGGWMEDWGTCFNL